MYSETRKREKSGGKSRKERKSKVKSKVGAACRSFFTSVFLSLLIVGDRLFVDLTTMADTGVKKEHAVLEEVPYDDDEVALVAAATEPAVDDTSPAEERETASASGAKSEAQTNGVLVLALLDKIIGVVDQIQQTQNGLEARQETMEKSVLNIQGELAKLSKNHVGTTDTVNKMLEKVRKVSVNVKTVRTNLEKQAGQIKKLESNENELLKRRNFKVLLYQVCLWGG